MPDLVGEDESDSDVESESVCLYSDEEGVSFADDGRPHRSHNEPKVPAIVETWHNRLGHLGSTKDIQDLISQGILPSTSPVKIRCDPCAKGKFRRFFRGSLTKSKGPGYLHADLVGRIEPESHDGFRYFLTIIDEATRYTWVVSLENKSDASK